MPINPFTNSLISLKERLKKRGKGDKKCGHMVRISSDVDKVLSDFLRSKLGVNKNAPDVIREALEIYFFYDLYQGNIEEKITPYDNRFERIEVLIKDSFQRAFGRSRSNSPEDYTIIEMLINVTTQGQLINMNADQIKEFKKLFKEQTVNAKRDFYEDYPKRK